MIFKIISLLPQWLVYLIADFLWFLGFQVFGYRRSIIRDNIRTCFPEFTEKEVKKTANQFGRQFLYVLGEAIYAYRFTEEDWKERVEMRGSEKVRGYIEQGKTVLVAYGHMTNWEWPFLSMGSLLNVPIEFLYRPMENNGVDKSLLTFREKHGGTGLPKDKAIRHILKHKDKPRVIGIIGDQIPSRGTDKQWLDFFNKETAFYQGSEKIAIATQSPVFFMEVLRTGRGRYQCTFHEIATPPYSKKHTGIIKSYAQHLEQNIRKQPEGYLWSHRRWKYTKAEDPTINEQPK